MSSRLLKAVTSPEIEVVGALPREGTGLRAGQLQREWTLGLSQRERGTRLLGRGQITQLTLLLEPRVPASRGQKTNATGRLL